MPFERLLNHMKETNDIANFYLTGRLVVDNTNQVVELEQHDNGKLTYITLTDHDLIEIRKGDIYIQITVSTALMYLDAKMGCSLYQGLYARVKRMTEQELIQGYNEMAATNLELAEEAFGAEVKAQLLNEEMILMMGMTNWEVAVEEMGFDVSKYEEYKLNFLIQTETDMQELLSLINEMKPRTLLPVVSQLRKNRIDANLIPAGQFIQEYKVNSIKALENLFAELVIEEDVEKLNNNGITVEQIYQYHLENPYKSLLTFLSFYRNDK